MVFEKCAQFFPADFCSSTPLLGKHKCGAKFRQNLKVSTSRGRFEVAPEQGVERRPPQNVAPKEYK